MRQENWRGCRWCHWCYCTRAAEVTPHSQWERTEPTAWLLFILLKPYYSIWLYVNIRLERQIHWYEMYHEKMYPDTQAYSLIMPIVMIVTIIIPTPKMGSGRFRVIGAGSVNPGPKYGEQAVTHPVVSYSAQYRVPNCNWTPCKNSKGGGDVRNGKANPRKYPEVAQVSPIRRRPTLNSSKPNDGIWHESGKVRPNVKLLTWYSLHTLENPITFQRMFGEF